MRPLMILLIIAVWLSFPPSLFCESIFLTWNENNEPDLAGYRLYWGKAPGRYSHSADIGDRTLYPVDSLAVGVTYYFAVTAVDWWGNESPFSNEVLAWVGDAPPLPQKLHLSANYPNPFNPGTFLNIQLPSDGNITVTVLNALGQTLKTLIDRTFVAGYHTVYWDGTNQNETPVPAGTYFILLETGGDSRIRPVTLVR